MAPSMCSSDGHSSVFSPTDFLFSLDIILSFFGGSLFSTYALLVHFYSPNEAPINGGQSYSSSNLGYISSFLPLNGVLSIPLFPPNGGHFSLLMVHLWYL